MEILKIIAWAFILVYVAIVVLLYAMQTRLIFHPGLLPDDYKFNTGGRGREVNLKTSDGETVDALFFGNEGADVVLYFHGNAGDLSSWQYVADDFLPAGFNFMIIDYRGYGKSSGVITEEGMYRDGSTAYQFLISEGFAPENIIVYGRSIGSGVAVHTASENRCKGLILESPYSSLSALANEKFPMFFPSLYLKYRFDNLARINKVKCPLIVLHGSHDSLIPVSHGRKLYERFTGRKELIIIAGGGHNDLHTFPRYAEFMREALPVFF